MTRRRWVLALPIALVAALTTVTTAPVDAAPTWLAATTISGDDAAAAKPAVVATDDAGNTTAVWETELGGILRIRAATHAAGGAWSDPVTISSLDTDSSAPSVDVDAAGVVTAVWLVNEGAIYSIASATRSTNGTWSSPIPLGAATSGSEPKVAVSDAGHATAVWSRDTGTYDEIRAAQRTSAGVWGAAQSLSESGRDALHPDVDVHRASGQATVVWDRPDGTHTVIQMSFRGPGNASWSDPLDMSNDQQSATDAHVAIADVGQTTIAWTRFDGAKSRVQAMWNFSDGIWGGATTLSGADQDAFDVRVAVDGLGEATVVWRRYNGSVYVVQASSHLLEGPWSAVSPLSDPAHTAMYPNVAAGSGEGAVASWYSQPTASWETRASRRSGGSWGSAQLLGGDVDPFHVPGIGVTAQGDALVTWAEPGGGPVRVRARALDVAGPPLQAFLAPTTGTALRTTSFSASAIDTWSSVASYDWTFGDGEIATGPSVTHKYAKSGIYHPTLIVTDTLGNTTTRRVILKVAARPVIKVLRLTKGTIHVGGRTTLTVKLNCAATLKLVFKGKTRGVTAVRTKKLPRGTSTLTITTFVGGKKLKPDTYVISATATDNTGTSAPKRVTLKVVR
jgi:hypothetical protein